MQYIADILHVSKATVSLVISGKAKGRVNPMLEKKILETARKYDYRVNEVARSLRTGQTKTIGVIVTDISNEFFGQVTFHIQEGAKKNGYLVLAANSNDNPADFASLAEMLLNKHVDGLIAVPTEGSEQVLQRLSASDVPLVILDRRIAGIDADFVGTDNFGSGAAAVGRMMAGGRKKIAMVCHYSGQDAVTERLEGYRSEMRKNQIYDPSLEFMIRSDSRDEDIAKAMRWCLDPENGVDGMIFCSRRSLSECIMKAMSLSLSIPSSIRILCFDNVDILASDEMNLECMVQPGRKIGEEAFRLLLEQIAGRKKYGEHLFPSENR